MSDGDVFDVDSVYDPTGNTLPRVIRGATNMSTFPPHNKWKRSFGKKDSFLLEQFRGHHGFTALLSEKIYFRGTDAFTGKDPRIKVLKGDSGVDWLFGVEGNSGVWSRRKTAYMGLIDIRDFPEIMNDLDSLPTFMRKDSSHNLQYGDHHQSMALWVGRGDADSGLHFDTNFGGFMYLVSGRKQVMMFPNEDAAYLYMRGGSHRMESSLFLGQILERQDEKKYELLQKTTPYLAVMEAGDALYIPNKWFHEVYSQGNPSIGVSAWIHQAG
mmetsp:Transcript_8630/g.15673  ORF Transcript_8630/g.15673 Transcript_8630/m.15673 type:complete len:270 (+) Transcript_8630:289-1098(+)